MDSNRETLDQFRSYLYLLARAHVGRDGRQKMDASDLVQQTLLDAHAKRDQFRGETDAERAAWLKKILTCNLVDALRHDRREKRDIARQQSLEVEISGSFRRAEEWLAESQPSPSENVERREDLHRLADALTQLPEAQRDAVICRHLQGMSLTEIAAELDRSETAVAGLIYRGLGRLHELLDQRKNG